MIKHALEFGFVVRWAVVEGGCLQFPSTERSIGESAPVGLGNDNTIFATGCVDGEMAESITDGGKVLETTLSTRDLALCVHGVGWCTAISVRLRAL
jgi:hypothetical protein